MPVDPVIVSLSKRVDRSIISGEEYRPGPASILLRLIVAPIAFARTLISNCLESDSELLELLSPE